MVMGSSWGGGAVGVVGVPMLGVVWESGFVFFFFFFESKCMQCLECRECSAKGWRQVM